MEKICVKKIAVQYNFKIGTKYSIIIHIKGILYCFYLNPIKIFLVGEFLRIKYG